MEVPVRRGSYHEESPVPPTAMTREPLSSRSLESKLRDAITQAAQRNTRIKIRDGDNLMLIVRPGGGASWVLEYRLAGRRKPLALGA